MEKLQFRSGWRRNALVLLGATIALPFAVYALSRGFSVTDAQERLTSRFWSQDALLATSLIYGHMISGAAIMVLAPLQMIGPIWRKAPKAHHTMGYIVTGLAVMTGASGLIYIGLRGTIGGMVMNAGFGFYGALMLFCAFRTVLAARAREPQHELWAQRLVILALASWLYRLHYGLWEIATGGAGSNPDFTGLFDRLQVFAFYLPYLALHNWWWNRTQQRQASL